MTQQDPDTSSFPPQAGHYPSSPSSPPPRRGSSGVAIGLLVLLVAIAAGLGLWMYNVFLADDDEQTPTAAAPESSSAPETVTVTAEPTTTESPEPAPEPEPEPEPAPEPAPEPEPAPTPEVVTVTATVSPGGYRAPDSAVQCAANINWRIYRANDRTSCGFAESVAGQMSPYAGLPGSAQIEAYSPVTGQAYVMNCITQGAKSYVCQGGDNAVVILESRSVRD